MFQRPAIGASAKNSPCDTLPFRSYVRPFYDLSREKELKIPTQGEKRERELQKLVARSGKPVALFVDEAHDLHGKTLTGLKRLMEVIARGGGNLSVILVGHPKLRNDLRRPTMEEIGHRTDILSFEGLVEDARAYLEWLLDQCTADDTPLDEIIEPAALDLLAERLSTPLQFGPVRTKASKTARRTVGVIELTSVGVPKV